MSEELSQEDRSLRFFAPSGMGGDELYLRSFDGEERLGCLFEYTLELRSKRMDLPLDFVGSAVAVEIDVHPDKRCFHGHITDYSFMGTKGDLALYRVTMRPWPWFLSKQVNYRVFQEKTVEDIIKQVFTDSGFSDYKIILREPREPRTYCVQYGESDFDFVSRLMEEEGMYYFFEHSREKHVLTIVDAAYSHPPLPGDNEVAYRSKEENLNYPHLNGWRVQKSLVSNNFYNRDYDFEKPDIVLEAKDKLALKHEHKEVGEIYVYPGGFTKDSDGAEKLKRLSEGLESQHERIYAEGNARQLCVGFVFKLIEYPREDQNANYMIISVRHSIQCDEMMTSNTGGEFFYQCGIEAMPSARRYRSQPVTPKPVVRGPQTAVVVGSKGEEIWCDKYGRVKVQFHWDREGKRDQNSSCWVRVAQQWADKKWGAIHTPRMGQEVVVSFLEGDPDKPLITGAVYNADNMPPYDLPDNQTQSGLKSRSSKDATDKNFNEFRFEDKKGEEEVYLQAEKDLKKLVKNDEKRVVANSRTTTIGLEDSEFPEGEPEEKGSEVEFLHIEGDVLHFIDQGDVTQTVKTGNVTQTVETGDINREATAGNVLEEAAQSIEFKVGGSSIKLEPAKITIKSPAIAISADATVNVESAMTTVKGSGVLTLQGGLVKIN